MNNRRVGTPPNPSLLSPLLKHLFVGDVPLLYPQTNIGRQIQVEVWLDLKLDLGSYGSENILTQYQEVKKRLEYVA